jgi:hypothetical protein
LLVSGTILATIPGVSHAQAPATTFDELASRVIPGATVSVTDRSGEKLRGRLLEITSSTLRLQAGKLERTFSSDTLAELRQPQSDSLVNGVLIGAAAGAAPFLFLIVSDWCSDEGPNCGGGYKWAGFYLAIGVGAGATLDALIRKDTVLYRRRDIAINLGPYLHRGRKGVALSVAF